MALFQRDRVQRPEVRLDDGAGTGEVRAAVALAAAGDLRSFDESLDDLDPDAISIAVRLAAKKIERRAAEMYVAEYRDHAFAYVLLGAVLVTQAAATRGSAQAQDTAREALNSFAGLMARAAVVLERATELGPEDPEAWAQLLSTAHTSGGNAMIYRCLPQLEKADPWHVHGLTTATDLLGQKWYGEVGQAQGLAEAVSAQAPPASNAQIVVPHCVRELWLQRSVFEKDDAGAQRLLDDPRLHAWLVNALDRSLRHPAYRPSAVTARVRNEFAFAFHLVGDADLAAEQFRALDGAAQEMPWKILDGDNLRAFEAAQRAALR